MTVLVDGFTNSAADTMQTAFSAVSNTLIQAFTATNLLESSITIKAAIVGSDGVIRNTLPLSIIVRDRANTGFELVNQEIPAGGSLRFECNQIAGAVFRVTGREVS